MGSSRIRRHYHSGFTLIEVLFSLFITCLIVINISSVISVLKYNERIKTINSDVNLGLQSVANYLITGKDFKYGSTLLFKNQEDEDCSLELDNNRLILKPGTNIFCRNIDNISFYKNNNLIHIRYNYEDSSYDSIIGSDYQDELIEEEVDNEK